MLEPSKDYCSVDQGKAYFRRYDDGWRIQGVVRRVLALKASE
jgi:hypothetical protein